MPTRMTRAMSRRRVYRRRRQVAGGALLLFCLLVVMAGLRLSALAQGPVGAAGKGSEGKVVPKLSVTSTPKTMILPSAPAVPLRATGTYARAAGGTERHGSGTLKTYRVEVETGTGQEATSFATAVDATLANPASWTGQGRWSLQRVDTDGADLVIRLATPATVDKVCATVGLDTRGYVSCRAGELVMINLNRWLYAVPEYGGDVAQYRQYVINHEVGHGLGLGHQSCPGPGMVAPVMQQQTLGLGGCQPNGWPYVAGVFVSGPQAQ